MQIQLTKGKLVIEFNPKNTNEKHYITALVDTIDWIFDPTYVTYVQGKKIIGRKLHG